MSKYYSSSIAFGAQQTKTEKVVVSPTKIGDVTTDAVSGALTVDEVPVLNSLNPVSSDGVARAVIQAGAELPTRGSSDTGKVLTVANSDGDLEWDEPAEELPSMEGNDGKLLGAVDNNGTMEARWVNPPDSYPTVAGNANKVLTVNSGATGVEWANVPTELPSIAGNASKVLKVNDGATAVEWASESTELPAATSADNGKVLGVTDTSGTLDWVAQTPAQVNADWNSSSGKAQILNKPNLATVATTGSYSDLSNTPTIPTVDQSYSAVSTNAQSGAAVAEAISGISVDEVPDVGSTDDGKVLTASYSGGQGSYSWQTAQGGGSSYTAGDGIDISAQDAISAKVGNGLEIGNASTTVTGTTSGTYYYQSNISSYRLSSVANLNATLVNAIDSGNVTFTIDKVFSQPSSEALVPIIYLRKSSGDANINSYIRFSLTQPTIALDADHKTPSSYSFVLNAANIDTTRSSVPWANVKEYPDAYFVGLCRFNNGAPVVAYTAFYNGTIAGTETNPMPTGTYSYNSQVVGRFINVTNPLPASAQADANKVLTVDANGKAGWETPAAIPVVDQTYSAASTNAQSGVAVAEAIAAIPAPSVREVPNVASYSDDGKILTASWNLSTGTGSYAWATPNFSVGTWETINLTNTEYGYYYADAANGLQKNTMYLLRISVVPANDVPNTVLYLRVALTNSNRDPRGQSVDRVVVRVPWDPTEPSYSGAPFTVTAVIPVSHNPSDSSLPEGTGFAVCASTTSSTSPSSTYLTSVSVQCLPLGAI